jgi:hypothetical protein
MSVLSNSNICLLDNTSAVTRGNRVTISQISCPVCRNGLAIDAGQLVRGEPLQCLGCDTEIEIRPGGRTRATMDAFGKALGTLDGRSKKTG